MSQNNMNEIWSIPNEVKVDWIIKGISSPFFSIFIYT